MNNINLIGRLTKDVELTFVANTGNAVARFSIAVNRKFKKDEVDFINCVAFGKTGEIIAQYMLKGSQIAITGALRTGSYEAKDGTKKYTTDVIVESFDFIGKKENQTNSNFKKTSFEEEMTPVDNSDMPF